MSVDPAQDKVTVSVSVSVPVWVSVNSFHFFVYSCSCCSFCCFWFSCNACGVLLNLPQFEFVASQVRVLSLSLRSCSTVGPPRIPIPVARHRRRGRMVIIILPGLCLSFSPSVRLSVSLLAAWNFVGKLRLMIMFNGLYNNKYIAGPVAAAYWKRPKIATLLLRRCRNLCLFLSLSQPLSPSLAYASCRLFGGRMRRLEMTLIQLGAAVIYDHLATVRLIDIFLRPSAFSPPHPSPVHPL